MSIEIGNFNRIRTELQQKVDQLERKNKTLEDNVFLEVCLLFKIILLKFDLI